MAQLAMFPLFFVGIRVRSLFAIVARDDKEKALKLIAKTLDQIEALPRNYNDTTKEQVLECLEMAHMLMLTDCWAAVPEYLAETKAVLQRYTKTSFWVNKYLGSYCPDRLGALDALPADIRRHVASLSV